MGSEIGIWLTKLYERQRIQFDDQMPIFVTFVTRHVIIECLRVISCGSRL